MPMLFGKSDLITLSRKLMYQTTLTNALKQTYLYKWFVHTSFCPALLSTTSDSITIGRNLIYNFIPTIAIRQMYLQVISLHLAQT